MNKIKVMNDVLANKIAAGEVVEKCVSVVKELVENSVDAGSTEIKIEVVEAGTKLIKVVDNGSGMSKEDALLAFQRHATSKLYDEMGLFRISSLGFRGEALPSIAAVSKVELKTSTGKVGTKIIIDGGRLIKQEASDARKGTEIMVENLFYNTPARLKYLHSLYSELANICEYVNKMALSYPEIKFKLTSDDKVLLNTDGSGNLLKVIKEIYGSDVARRMRKISVFNDDYDVDGFVSLPEVTRSTRTHMVTLVNKRVVRNAELNRAINDAYHTYKPETRYPIVVLNINTDPSLIDVNVHPAKLDIKFSNFEDLKELIKNGIKQVLGKALLIPKIEKKEVKKQNVQEQQLNLERQNVIENETIDYSLFDDDMYSVNEELQIEEKKKEDEQEDKKFYNEEKKKVIMPEMYPIGLAKGTYIICHNELGIYLIDQHAAKERINYEGYKKAFGNPNESSIKMLVPLILDFPSNEFIIIKQNLDVLRNMHFDISEYGNNSFIVKEHPTWLKQGYEEESIKKILEVLISEEKNFSIEKFREKAAIMLSCKMAIKANMNISLKEMEALIDDLRRCENPYTCPHGRPTTIFFSNYELEKMFKRAM
ncbi:MAG TPA: DNA mismatch repair endonuclease MutL [Candidatus Aphodocola excrementigallinarum]|uniref:DNA mismatch repair protein MutL n=1 Tax=Candidatus Aphodocola excrementigallinarum TaxID=2840670 RepID=A0A9D1LHI8_9FIRM|nr:DNA mismatch repair endonuclease MutL [Candidatus Aphodocola excrementigallinarum]